MFRPRILLVRHGETDDNKNRIFQGQKGHGLNALGKEQASRLATRLAGARIGAAFASDLQRARETAEIVAAPHGLTVQTKAELREVDVGAWSGVSYDDVKERFPEEYAAWKAGLDVRRGGGETYDELAARMIKVLGWVCDNHNGLSLCVSHGGAIRSVIRTLLGHGSHPRVLSAADNTGITLLERSEPGDGFGEGPEPLFRVVVYNDTNHLEDAVLGRIPNR
jgi:probable phosphoglycerate mutase